MPAIDREDECLRGYKEQVEKKRAGDTIKEICPKCGQSVLDCGCRLYSNKTDWPMSGDKPRTGIEMTARFSQLKKSGTGTIFAPVDSEGHATYGGPALTIDLAPGAIIGGLYEIIRLIGRGGMGEVYLARQMTLNKNCALKVIPPDQLTEVAWLRFQLEAKAVAQLNHINLVRVTDLGIHEDCLPFYAMEYLEGANLAEMLAEHGPMPLEQALEIFIQVCDGVECAHRAGILHRDLKPANIMLTRAAKGKMEVKILDFGLAKLTRHDREKQSLTAVGDIFGSPSYMSPEQCGGETLDHRTDIYSIGCTLFESLTGRPPFNAQESAAVFLGHLTVDPPTLDSVTSAGTFPPEMERIMARLLRKNVDERYQSLADLKRDLESILGGVKVDDRTTGGRAKSETAPVRVRPGMRGQVRRPANPPGTSGTPGESGASGTGTGAAGKRLLLALLLGGFVVSSVVALGTYFNRQERPVTAAVTTADAPLAEAPTAAAPTAPVDAEAQSSQTSADPLTKLAGDVDDESTFVLNGTQIGTNDSVVWDHKPFYQGVVEREGRHYQLWSYHGRPSPPVYLEFMQRGKAKRIGLYGEILLPATKQITLWPRFPLIRDPELINGLVGANCRQVDYRWLSLGEVRRITPVLAACPSISGLALGNPHWTMTDSLESVVVINQYPNLERLELGAPFDGSALLKLRRLQALHELRLNFTSPQMRDCLQAISGCPVLRSLAVASWPLPADDLALLARFSGLQRLMLGGLTGSSEQLAFLAKMPELRRLDLPDLRYRPDLVADLEGIGNLRVLRFSARNEWNKEQIAKLQVGLPKVRLELYENGSEQWQSMSELR